MTTASIFAEHATVLRASAVQLAQPLDAAIASIRACLASGHKVMACGNGGSAASAQHFVAELVCRFHLDRKGLAGIALTSDAATLTAIGNDYGYECLFARQVEALGTNGDVLLAISTSGNSPNVLAAAKVASNIGCHVLALTGADGGALAPLADVALKVPSNVVARIQEVHDVCIHAMAEALEPDSAGTRRRARARHPQ